MNVLRVLSYCLHHSFLISAFLSSFRPNTIKFRQSITLLRSFSPESVAHQLKIWEVSSNSRRQNSTSITHIVDNLNPNDHKAVTYLRTRWFSSSNKAAQACADGFVTVNGHKIYGTRKLKIGDELCIAGQAFNTNNKEEIKQSHINRLCNYINSLISDNISSNTVQVLYEDDDLAVVFKPSGLHSLTYIGTLKKQLFSLDDVLPLFLDPPPSPQETEENKSNEFNQVDILSKPTPCHRLDYRVSGCLLVAKKQSVLKNLNKQFELKQVKKEYRAILVGSFDKNLLDQKNQMIINIPVGGRNATSILKFRNSTPCNIYGSMTYVSLYPLTGRRHQLRQHCAYLGCPILGDDLYHNAAFSPLESRLQCIETAANESQQTSNSQVQIDGVPLVRKGIGLLLMSVAVEFCHPTPSWLNNPNFIEEKKKLTSCVDCSISVSGESLRVEIPVAEKFIKIFEKARKGANWAVERINTVSS